MIEKNKKGFAFLALDPRWSKDFEDIFIPEREAGQFLHGDRVRVDLDKNDSVLGIQVLESRFRTMLGRFEPDISNPRSGWLVCQRKRFSETVFIPHIKETIPEGSWIHAKIQVPKGSSRQVTAEILKVFPGDVPASHDLEMISGEYGIDEHHPKEVVQEAKHIRAGYKNFPKDRKDFSSIPFMTIDGADARDFDDAVHVEKKGKEYVLWVAIADVSHYIRPRSALDQSASARGTSVYLPEKAFHMLPKELSEEVCSLVPNEKRLAMCVQMTFSVGGKLGKTKISEALIKNHRRYTYEDFQSDKKKFPHHYALYDILKQSRFRRGSIDFNFDEAKIRLNAEGEPIEIGTLQRLDSHRLIEEFMIATNEAVTAWAIKNQSNFIYRVHEKPDADSFERFKQIAKTLGHPFRGKTFSPKTIGDFIKSLGTSRMKTVLTLTLLRSMKQAHYTAARDIHFGLASNHYTHFTSPIRRYPDLIVHRLIRDLVRNGPSRSSKKEKQKKALELERIAEHCSHRERLADSAEKESIKLKQIRFMLPHVGNPFQGEITGFSKKGIFVKLNDPFVEGMIPMRSLQDDYYRFVENQMMVVGRRTRRKFQIGMKVKVRLDRADLEYREIDFGLISVHR